MQGEARQLSPFRLTSASWELLPRLRPELSRYHWRALGFSPQRNGNSETGSPGLAQGPQATIEPRAAQASPGQPGQPRLAQDSRGQPRPAQASLGQPRLAQASRGQPRPDNRVRGGLQIQSRARVAEKLPPARLRSKVIPARGHA